jgi:catechol 2,3-dioxygenase-like lactoylglutathione lyase family enzyme
VAITGIESLVYGVDDVARCTSFFQDFGLRLAASEEQASHFRLPEGSNVIIRHKGDASLPASSLEGPGVREVIWAVDSADALERLVSGLARDREVRREKNGDAHFLTDFGLAMGLRVAARQPVVCAPDPVNAPDRINRLNQHRKWRLRAHPKVISHVVFAAPDYEAGAQFMCERLDFRLSDSQRGFGKYLRADGSRNHHNFLLLNARAPFPDMDGKLRFHHANFGVEDIDEIMVGANHMVRKGWPPSHLGLGRHRIDSALFYYLPCPAGGEAEYGADADYVDDSWVPREWPVPLFGFSHFVHNLPPFLMTPPAWEVSYLTGDEIPAAGPDKH